MKHHTKFPALVPALTVLSLALGGCGEAANATTASTRDSSSINQRRDLRHLPPPGSPTRCCWTSTRVSRIDEDGDGVVAAVEADLEDTSDGGQSNERLYLPAGEFTRFAVTREINDGLLAPRFSPSQRAWVLGGPVTSVSPTVDASAPQEADNR